MDVTAAWARPAVEAVLNGVWQGILLVAVLALGMRLARRANAASRYAVWWITLLAVAALPAVGWLWRRAGGLWSLGAPFGEGGISGPALLLPGGTWPEVLLMAWGVVSAALLLRVARGFRSMQALKARSEPLLPREAALFEDLLAGHASRRPIRIRRSRELPSPITAGLTDPMILMPADLLGRLEPEDLRRIVLHELTHVRRGDDRAILIQRFLESLFFFHPAVRVVAARLDLEREVACDDRVVELTGERKAYARCLAQLAELGAVRNAALASGALLHRGHLVRRVTLLLDARRRVGERVSAALAGGALAALGAAVLWLGAQRPVLGVPAGADDVAAASPAAPPLPTPLTPEEALAAAPLPAPPVPLTLPEVEGGASSAPPSPRAEAAAALPTRQPARSLAGWPAADGAGGGTPADTEPWAPLEPRVERAVADEDADLLEEDAAALAAPEDDRPDRPDTAELEDPGAPLTGTPRPLQGPPSSPRPGAPAPGGEEAPSPAPASSRPAEPVSRN